MCLQWSDTYPTFQCKNWPTFFRLNDLQFLSKAPYYTQYRYGSLSLPVIIKRSTEPIGVNRRLWICNVSDAVLSMFSPSGEAGSGCTGNSYISPLNHLLRHITWRSHPLNKLTILKTSCVALHVYSYRHRGHGPYLRVYQHPQTPCKHSRIACF